MLVPKNEVTSRVSEFRRNKNLKKPRYLHQIRSQLKVNTIPSASKPLSKYSENETPFPEVIAEVKTFIRRKLKEYRQTAN